MGRQKVKITKRRVKKNGSSNSQGYAICKNCGGDGLVQTRKKKK